MEIIGYIAALLIGISLGLIGGGGSILTVPVLVYLFGLSPLVAVSYSLFIVGTTSLAGAINNFRKGFVHLETVFLFGIASIFVTVMIRRLVIPRIPANINIGSWETSFSFLTIIVFGALMVFASLPMIRGRKEPKGAPKRKSPVRVLVGYGIVIGLITGFLGAGGGFLMIPAMVLFMQLPMKTAVGSSLFIIAMNSLFGFAADAGLQQTDWLLLARVTAIAIAGVFVGGMMSRKVTGEQLRKGFGWFVLLMGVFIVVKEMIDSIRS